MQQNNNCANAKLFRDYERLAKLFYSGATFVAFDTETTGLNSCSNHMTEIGAVKFNCAGEISSFDQLIKPPVPIPRFLEQLTHITNEMVADCPDASSVLTDFLSFIDDKDTVLVAHNARFDLGFISMQMARMNLPMFENKTIDSLALSRWVHPEFKKDKEEGPYKLQNLAKRFNIEVRSAHRADDDARVLREVFLRILSDSIPMQKDFDPSMIRTTLPPKPEQLELF